MSDNPVLNVVIGLVFIFLIYSLFATAMQEAIANMLQRRANMLQYGIKVMLTKTVNNNNLGKFGLIWYYLKKALQEWGDNMKSLITKRPTRTMHDQFYNHPIIKNYGQNSWFSKPSYIGASNFSTVLIDTIKNIDKKNLTVAADFKMLKDVLDQFSTDVRLRIPNALNKSDTEKKVGIIYADADKPKINEPVYKDDNYTYEDTGTLAYTPDIIRIYGDPQGDTTILAKSSRKEDYKNENLRFIDKETLQILTYHMNEAGGDIDVFRSRLEKWYNDTMDRVTGWYKKNTHYWLFAIGLFLAFNLNIDTIEISNHLSKNKAAAEQLAKMGEAAVASDKESTYSLKDSVTRAALDSIRKDMQQVNTLLGLGWKDYGRTDPNFIKYLRQKKWGKWYTLGIPTCWDKTLQDRFPVSPHTIDSINNMVRAEINLLEKTWQTDTAKLRSSRTKSDTVKTMQDSILFFTAQADSSSKKDSLYLLAFYDTVAQDHHVHIRETYICSKTFWKQKLFGFFITAIAIGLGAPFWYDLLNKLVSIKSAGKIPDGKKKETT
ncbi:MAG: hypothetical protein K0Q79_2075 [Flavipsychrobacter sp.]|jgi:hypothetical protein|nr:hypothetical protein [Flavipsychrobacter sp.]